MIRVRLSMTLLVVSIGSATSKMCKLANSIKNITKGGTQLGLIITIIYTDKKKKLHRAQIGSHSVCTWFSEKEKNKGLVTPSETE